jgi:hypothetical protein
VHQLSADYTPQQNGRAERLNRTLMEKTRALLLQHHLSQAFWACALDTASHLKNCTAAEHEKTSAYELFFKRKPNLFTLRVFGCLAYVRVPGNNSSKLDARAMPGVFTGYEPSSKAWRVYVYQDGWVSFKSRDVRFIEHKRPDEVLENIPEDEPCQGNVPDPLWLSTAETEDQQTVEPAETADDEESEGDNNDEVALHQDEAQPEEVVHENHDSDGDEPSEAGYNASEDEDASMQEDGDVQGTQRSARTRKPSVRFREHYVYHARGCMTDQPNSVQEALKRPDAVQWQDAINAELTALVEKNTYTEMVLPPGKTAIPSKFVLNIKRDAFGKIDKYKARLVALGCRQIAGEDFTEVFAPTIQLSTVRVLLAIAAARGLHVHQIDVKTAFLNGDIEEEVYIKPPATVRRGNEVWRLNKALYGLKQAARQWHIKLREQLQTAGYVGSAVDPCLFMKGEGKACVYIIVHVDDALLVGEAAAVQSAKSDISKLFDIKDLGSATYFLGKEIIQTEQGIWIGQTRYASDLLTKFSMFDSKPAISPMAHGEVLSKQFGMPLDPKVPYAELVASLLYLSTNTRPDIAYAVGVLSRFMSKPMDKHWTAAKRVLRYLAGTYTLGLFYARDRRDVSAYSDADFAGDVDQRKSTSGMVVVMNGAAIMWRSKLQSIVTTSTCEAEYVSASDAAKEVLWLSKLLCEISSKFKKLTLHVDNQSALSLMRLHHAGTSGRTKHIDVNYHFLRDRVIRGDLDVDFVATEEQVADGLTKVLNGSRMKASKAALGLMKKEDASH